jgi:hypothetical protein
MWYRNRRRIGEVEVVDTVDVSFWGIKKSRSRDGFCRTHKSFLASEETDCA